MNENQLSKRLETAASYIQKGARLADIGSDHAYLPCNMAQQGIIEFGIAGEVVIGPFTSAKKQITASRLEGIVEARLGNGLEVIQSNDLIDTITICGMGGDLIARILDAGYEDQKLDTVKRLILQPNNAEMKLRRWLIENGFEIIEETIIEENEKIYEIIIAEPAKQVSDYTFEDYLFGKFLRSNKNEAFIKKWQSEIHKYEYILDSLEQSQRDITEKKAEVLRMMQIIKEEIQ
ncbi:MULTISPECIES: tRNA (adenine(22)-N(1))-methyltransferase [unclassified Jeotgalibaca]|uniref:tRNA (adenine(22)-N(1))-methyltransferase n=1 Tax=unclassified Jeotgalibaca TaxID=2621505 RepID=UPI003FD001F0